MKKYYAIYFVLSISTGAFIGVEINNYATFVFCMITGWFHKEGTNFLKAIHNNTHITFMNLNTSYDWHFNVIPGFNFGNLGYGAPYHKGFVLNFAWAVWILNITYSQKRKL